MKFSGIKLFLGLVMLLASTFAWAQGPQPPSLDQLKKELALTADQEASIEAILAKYRPQLQEARQNADPAVGRAAAAGVLEAQRQEIRQVLSPEQNEKFDTLSASRKARGEQAGPPPINPELQKEVRSYLMQKVLPVLAEQRRKLDPKISAADQKILDSLRLERRGSAQQLRGARQDGGDVRAMLQEGRAQRQQTNAVMMPLVERYRTEIDGIMAGLGTQIEQWQTDLQAIHDRYPAPAGGRKLDGTRALDAVLDPAAFLLMGRRGRR